MWIIIIATTGTVVVIKVWIGVINVLIGVNTVIEEETSQFQIRRTQSQLKNILFGIQ